MGVLLGRSLDGTVLRICLTVVDSPFTWSQAMCNVATDVQHFEPVVTMQPTPVSR